MTPDKIQSYIELLAFALLSALVISYLLTPAVMKLGFLLGMVDEPGGRRIHENPTPRCGGLAVYLAFAATLALMCCAVRFPQIKEPAWIWAQTVLFAGTPLIVLGLIDDRWEVRPHVKLLGQIAIAAFAWNQGFRLEKLLGVEIIQALDLGATIFLYVAGMNAYNLIDGMDGVAAGLGAITGLGLAGLNLMIGNESMAAFCLALTGGCLGFLRFNFHPARVFLGDTGSMFIGYVLISLTLGSQARSTAVIMLIIPLLTMGVPMIDTGLAIWRRSGGVRCAGPCIRKKAERFPSATKTIFTTVWRDGGSLNAGSRVFCTDFRPWCSWWDCCGSFFKAIGWRFSPWGSSRAAMCCSGISPLWK